MPDPSADKPVITRYTPVTIRFPDESVDPPTFPAPGGDVNVNFTIDPAPKPGCQYSVRAYTSDGTNLTVHLDRTGTPVAVKLPPGEQKGTLVMPDPRLTPGQCKQYVLTVFCTCPSDPTLVAATTIQLCRT